MSLRAIVLFAISACGRLGFDAQLGGTIDQPVGVGHIASGPTFSCAIRSDRSLWCWGSSSSRELGRDSLVAQPTPVRVDALASTPLAMVAAGDHFACAVGVDGAAWCWGDNDDGQLGIGVTTEQPTPVKVIGLPGPVVEIALGYRHACARLADDSAWCWGDNSVGQLGRDSSTTTYAAPVSVLSEVLQVVAGEAHTCALRADGTVWCWGSNLYGVLGDDTGDHAEPRQVVGLLALRLGSGAYHVCALVLGDRFTCWGNNSNGTLGDPALTDSMRSTPGPRLAAQGMVTLTAGLDHSCGLGRDGSVVCWGDNDVGELGDGTLFDSVGLTDVSVPGSVVGIAAGGYHTCAIRDDDAVTCWGRGSSGELGDGHLAEWAPVTVGLPGAASSVAAGYDHACAIVAGAVYCWGSNGDAQIGQPGSSDYQFPSPTLVPGIAGATSLALGATHSCATLGTGSVMCWGGNWGGQLGIDSTSYAEPPSTVPGLTAPITAIAAGNQTTCAIANSVLRCWGRDDYGQQGDGGGASVKSPRTVTGGTFIDVTLGDLHGCALDSTFQVQCWGDNARGQLGIGTSGSAELPTPLANNGQYKRLAAGYEHTCAISQTDQVECWGSNQSGELGDGTFDSRELPGPSTLAFAATAVVAGDGFSCALSAGTVRCWGDNLYGQIGNGKVSLTLVPVDARFP